MSASPSPTNTNITPTEKPPTTPQQQRQQVMLTGALGGMVFGLLGAWLFNRAAGEAGVSEKTHRVTNGELIALVVSAFAFLRQVVELGRPEAKNTRRGR